MADGFQVYFRSGSCDLDAAIRSLKHHRLTTTRHGDSVKVRWGDSPEFDIGISAETWIREEAAEVGERTPHAAAMSEYDARFEVSFESLDEVVDEMNMLIAVQAALQETCNGLVFLPWNGRVFRAGEE